MFEILTATDVTLRTLTPRTEKHGDDEVSAMSLGLTITAPNTLLDALQPGLRTMLYTAVEGQEQLPGVEPATPLLRAKGVESVHLAACLEGWTLKVDQGIDEDNPIELGGSKVDKFVVHPHEGGSVDLTFRVGTSDIDESEAGWLFGRLRQIISVTLHAPKQRAPAIDGTTEAFRRDHPGAQPSAEDLFAGGGGPEDGEPPADGDDDTEGGAADAQAEDKPAPRRRSRRAAEAVE